MQTTTEKSTAFQELCKSFNLEHREIPEILTFEDACKVRGVDPLNLPNVSMIPAEHQKAIIAQHKLIIIAEALNTVDGKLWIPDYTNSDEYKYEPYFWFSSGGGFSYCDCDLWHTFSDVGARLCFLSRTIAKYAGKQFIELYKDLLTK